MQYQNEKKQAGHWVSYLQKPANETQKKNWHKKGEQA
jgi:hypothetical protein